MTDNIMKIVARLDERIEQMQKAADDLGRKKAKLMQRKADAWREWNQDQKVSILAAADVRRLLGS